MNYGELISSAFRITWRNRYMWFFGFFAAGSGGGGFGGGSSSNSGTESAYAAASLAQAPDDPALIAIGVVGLVLIVIFILLALLSHGGLVDSVTAVDRGERRDFRSTWHAGRANIWPVFKLIVLGVLLGLAGLIVIGVPLGGITWAVFSASDAVALRIIVAVLLGLIALIALIVLWAVLTIVTQLALRRLVLAGGGAREAIRSAYALFRSRVGPCLLVFLIGIAFAIGIFIAVVAVLLLLLLMLGLPSAALLAAEAQTAGILVVVIGALIVIPVALVVMGALGAFQHAYWTLAYLRLTGAGSTAPGPPSVPAVL